MTEAARRNTVAKFGIEFNNTHRIGLCSLLKYPRTPEPFETVSISEPGLYALSTGIRVNGAALILLPDVLEEIGKKARMDYFIIPSSIHELLIARDDGLITSKMLKELAYEGNRTDAVIKQEDVLSDNIFSIPAQKNCFKFPFIVPLSLGGAVELDWEALVLKLVFQLPCAAGDAGGLTPAKGDNAAMRKSRSRTGSIPDRMGQQQRIADFSGLSDGGVQELHHTEQSQLGPAGLQILQAL